MRNAFEFRRVETKRGAISNRGRIDTGRLGGTAVLTAAKRKTIPKSVRQQVYDSMNGHCGYCGCDITYKEMQVDHIDAVYLHEKELNAGEAQQVNSIENYMPACRACNFYKSTMSIEQFRKQLETLQERLEKIFIYRLAKKYGIVKEFKKPVQFYFEKVKNGVGSA